MAILRVVAWHTYGYAVLSYLIASMPAMFFVAGALMAHSLRRGGALTVLYRRFYRLLIPLWLIGAFAIAVMIGYNHQNPSPATQFDRTNVLWWILPIWDPQGSDWGLTWWTTLWYLRATAWLLLASPPLLWLWRRIGPALLILPLLGIILTEERLRADHTLAWQVQDFALYSFFWMLGFAYTDGLFARFSTPVRALLALAFAVEAAVWALTQDVPGGIVNASYPLHLLVGLAWLFGALAIEAPLGRLAQRPRISSAIYWVNERALTIYLWQSAGLFCMYQILWAEPHSRLTRDLLALPIVASVTLLATLLFGWAEDVAAGRAPRLWPRRPGSPQRRRGALSTAALGLAATAMAASGLWAVLVTGGDVVAESATTLGTSRARTVPPSGVGLRLRTERARIFASAPTPAAPSRTRPVTTVELQTDLESWLNEKGFSGATVTIMRGSGETWTGAAGLHAWGTPFEANELYGIASITKTFTVALIMRLVEHGLVDLDAPMSHYVREYPLASQFTVRQLIQHRSGLIPTDQLPPDEALAEAELAGLQFEPGSDFLYSTPGYMLLGLVIENVMNRSYTEVLHRDLLDPLGLTFTYMDEDLLPLDYSTHPYWVHPELGYYGILWSAGGIWSTTEDLARWANALWGGDTVVSPASLDAMTTFLGREFAFTGLGTYPFCPCWTEDRRLRADTWGHLGVSGMIEYDPEDRIAVSMSISGTLVDENVEMALEDLSIRLRDLIRGRPFAAAEPDAGPAAEPAVAPADESEGESATD
ncbi:MAG: hypothetical protein EXR43_02735 [Dehalococcoidia bacterium]|nr:hypothetical protein [Dehalococcoidia bacterium]